MNIEKQTGEISVQTNHIFPIIKKWLYSEKEIFLREIVSNACDAVTKAKRLSSLGELPESDKPYRVDVILNKTNRTLTVNDKGIGMTEDELKKYICQIALSGALDFIEKYESSENASESGIIGHFGLGFYSSFMVSEQVEVITRSRSGGDGVRWVCTDDGSYEITAPYAKDDLGTSVVMHISDEGLEYLDMAELRAMLDKYCSFMPVEIYLTDEEAEKKDGDIPSPVNDVHPLWQKSASECGDEEYKEFYRKVFSDYKEPLFHIHINADYPLNFKGILYFPKLSHEYESLEGQIKLYYNQVFVADNIKEVIPEYLLMLRGVLDCPELPLNVSRSYLQNSTYVSKISAHIVKKVADKLCGMFNSDREAYEKLWDDIHTFAEYASLCDRKFYDRAKSAMLLKATSGKHLTLDEYLEGAKEKHQNTVYYTNDPQGQTGYLNLFRAQGIEVVELDRMIDVQYISMLESTLPELKFVRVDADIANALCGEGESVQSEELEKLFREVSGNESLTVKCEKLIDEKVPALLTLDEQSRRMGDMMRMYAQMSGQEADSGFPTQTTLVLNASSKLIEKLRADSGSDKAKAIAKHIYSLALISQRRLSADELQSFLNESYDILMEL